MKTRVQVDAVRRDGKAVKLYSREINSESLWYNIGGNTKVFLYWKRVHKSLRT